MKTKDNFKTPIDVLCQHLHQKYFTIFLLICDMCGQYRREMLKLGLSINQKKCNVLIFIKAN